MLEVNFFIFDEDVNTNMLSLFPVCFFDVGLEVGKPDPLRTKQTSCLKKRRGLFRLLCRLSSQTLDNKFRLERISYLELCLREKSHFSEFWLKIYIGLKKLLLFR